MTVSSPLRRCISLPTLVLRVALPANYLLVAVPQLALQAAGNSAWVPDFSRLYCVMVALACLARTLWIRSRRRSAGSGVWSLTLTLLAADAGSYRILSRWSPPTLPICGHPLVLEVLRQARHAANAANAANDHLRTGRTWLLPKALQPFTGPLAISFPQESGTPDSPPASPVPLVASASRIRP